MSNTINADNGVVSGVAGLKYSADTSGQLILQTNTTNAVTIDTTQNVTFATGILATNPFVGTYTDGTIVDYITGVGRINVGPSDDIAFYHNGIGSRTEIARFTYTGRLGVGTASPSTKIQATVSPSSGGDDGMRVTDGTRIIQINITGSAYSYIGIGASETMLYSTGNPLNIVSDGQPIKFITGTSEKMRLDTSGNLGIGTSSPGSRLAMFGATGSTNGIQFYASGWNSIGRLGNNGTSGGDLILSENWNANANTVDSAGNATAYVNVSATSGSIMFGTGNTGVVPAERMRIDTSGNVGINTTAPNFTLQVNGTNEWPIALRAASNTITYRGTFLCQKALGTFASPLVVTAGTILGGLETGGYNGTAYTLGYNGGSAIMTYAEATWTGTSNPTYIAFSTNATGVAGYAERMRINSSGYVTTPYQPAFSVGKGNGDVSPGNTIIFNVVFTNTGSFYNTTTGRFTAPVTGRYYVAASLMTNGNVIIDYSLYINGTVYQNFNPYQDATGGAYNRAAGSSVVSLNSGDYIELVVNQGTIYANVPSGRHTMFCGYLIG